MRRRIAAWALCGLAVACFWFVYGMAAGPTHNLGRWPIVTITAPAMLLGRHMPLRYQWFILLNGAAYALLGLAIEPIRKLISGFNQAH